MKNILGIFTLIMLQTNIAMAQTNLKVLTKEEEENYNLSNLKFYKMSSYNESIAYLIDEANVLVLPNVPAAEHSIIMSISDFKNDNFPLLPENDTPYYKYRKFMNVEDFTMENMLNIFDKLNFKYQEETFFGNAEKFIKTLNPDDKSKFLIPALYFIGQKLRKLCSNADWQFYTLHYFQPFAEPNLYDKKCNFSFHDLNAQLESKLLRNKNITFNNIYKRLEKKYNKEKIICN